MPLALKKNLASSAIEMMPSLAEFVLVPNSRMARGFGAFETPFVPKVTSVRPIDGRARWTT